ncbi:hypothetical protein QBC37DRAFT_178544 [Rhypophila decipiens]|uniref:SPT2 chromatin protein n=1 Tax=Rhypophila decipiens TaxID=261697 RepID=A0AAN6YGN2_9PEZI|nr:hypothetical protein QBC37DRAFT_178544 [Rhypophila decipiens]
MPISDLLASITGEKSTTSPTTVTRPSLTIPKRKAEDELRGPTPKTPRTEPVTNGSSRPNGNSSKPLARPADKPASTTTASKPSLNSTSSSTRPINQVSRNTTTASSRPTARPSSTTNGKPMPSRAPANGSSTADTGIKAATKKGSFAEIMARAKANAALSQSFGKIQHKTVEKGPSMKERKELKAEETRQLKKGAGSRQLAGRTGATSLASRPGAGTTTSRGPLAKPSGLSKPGTMRSKPSTGSSGEEKEKKIKKAALATTGYTGTARPRPGASTSKPGSSLSAQRNGTSRPRPGGYGGALSGRKSRADEEEDEFDDFIEYDDEEEEPPYGGGRAPRYYSEDESDMEAGLSDIDEEEMRAAKLALLEDKREERLEAELKRQKEARKKQLAAGRGR